MTRATTTTGRLTRMIRCLLLFESAMYSAVTPVLPHYAHALHASKPALGLLTAGYPAGLIPGALLGGWLASRHGVRRTAIAGLVGFGLAIAGFGLATDLIALDLLRVVQGMFCGLIWGGGLTWVIAAVPAGRRGAVIGGVIGAATFGTLLGPVLGTLAVAAGTRPVFCATGAVALALAAWARLHPEPDTCPPTGSIVGQLRGALGAGGFGLGVWLITLEAMFFGAANVLLPLRMAHFGASGLVIGVTFVAASALSTVLSPLVGRTVDRRGASLTIAVGLLAGAPLVAALALPHDVIALVILAVIALGAPMTAGMIPAVSLMTEATERAGVTLIIATTAVNLAYAVGESVGAPAAAGISQATGDAVPLLIISGLLLATLGLVRRAHLGSTTAPAGTDEPDAHPARTLRRPALHTARASAPDSQRRPRRGDRRRADRADRPSPVRLGSEAPPRTGDTAAADGECARAAERP
jgi:ACDE family multidrug resistance protein